MSSWTPKHRIPSAYKNRKFQDGDRCIHKTLGRGVIVDSYLSRIQSVHFVPNSWGKKISGWIRVAKRDLKHI